MSDTWVDYKLEDIAEFKYGKSLSEPNREPGIIPVVGSGGVAGFHNKSIVKSGIVVGRKGSIGTVQWFDGPFFPIDTVYFVDKIKPGFDLKYFYYFLQSFGLENYNSDAAVPGLSRALVYSLKAKFPSIEIQKKIASILSQYDQLIDINAKRIAILEKTAEQLYKEWFVRMRFPGYENTKFEKGIPDGWSIANFGDFVVDKREGIKKEKIRDEDTYVGLEHLPIKSLVLNSWGKGQDIDSDKLKFKSDDILFCKIRPYLHKVAIASIDGICSTDTIIMRPKKDFYLFYAASIAFSDFFIDFATITANGTKMPRADWKVLKKFPCLNPGDDLLANFHKVASPIFKECNSLIMQNKILETSRNYLLPRLISGQLSVEHLTEAIKETT